MRHNAVDVRKKVVAFLMVAIATLAPQADTLGQQTSDEASTIRYEVDLSDAKNHYMTITATIPADGDTTELMMAVWTPGSYLVREYARHIDTMEVTANGKQLDFEKTRKNRWLVQTTGVDSFQLKYHLYCNEMTVRTNWVGKQYAMINGAPSYITVPGRLANPHEVRLIMPRGWTKSATSLRTTGDSPNTFLAEDFDELVDSPIVAGNINIYPFVVSGVEHQLVNIGESGYWDGTKAATDLKRIVEQNHKMWDVVPYDRYLFLNMICESGGGLEHDNSTLIMTSRWSFRDPGRYKSWLNLASHEFFHAWNVRRLRPKSLVNYDYENEVYTDSLWIAEGITSYYQDLLMERAGFYSRTELLGKVSRNVESVQRTHGRKLQSLKDSSYDAWIKYYRQDENSSITQISYYSKGAVAAFLLDARIRKLTDGKKSLDDLMREMFKEFSKTGYTTEEFRRTASSVAGEDLSDWFASVIDSTDELDFSDIEALGVVAPNQAAKAKESVKESVKESAKGKSSGTKEADSNKASKGKPKQDAKEKPNATSNRSVFDLLGGQTGRRRPGGRTPPSARPAGNGRPWIGLAAGGDGIIKVSRVTPDSPAYDVGINLDDEIIAINGFRVSRNVDSRLSQYEIGDEIELLIARRGQLLTIRITIGSTATKSWRLRFVSRMSDDQKKQQGRWLDPSDSDEAADDEAGDR